MYIHILPVATNEATEIAVILRGDRSANSFCCAKRVSDVPTPPEGPLHPTDVTKNSCVLRWNPPKDDGGSEITHYVVEKMDADTSRWVPVGDPMGTSLR